MRRLLLLAVAFVALSAAPALARGRSNDHLTASFTPSTVALGQSTTLTIDGKNQHRETHFDIYDPSGVLTINGTESATNKPTIFTFTPTVAGTWTAVAWQDPALPTQATLVVTP